MTWVNSIIYGAVWAFFSLVLWPCIFCTWNIYSVDFIPKLRLIVSYMRWTILYAYSVDCIPISEASIDRVLYMRWMILCAYSVDCFPNLPFIVSWMRWILPFHSLFDLVHSIWRALVCFWPSGLMDRVFMSFFGRCCWREVFRFSFFPGSFRPPKRNGLNRTPARRKCCTVQYSKKISWGPSRRPSLVVLSGLL